MSYWLSAFQPSLNAVSIGLLRLVHSSFQNGFRDMARTQELKTEQSSCGDLPATTPAWKLLIAAIWIIGFLWLFFAQVLPNNSTSENQLSRMDLWSAIKADAFDLLNPFDYSWRDQQASWSNLSERVPHVITAVMIWLSAWGYGSFARALLLSRVSLRSAERFVVDGGLGLSLLSLIVLFCGVIGRLDQASLLGPGYVFGMLAIALAIKRKATGHGLAADSKHAENLKAVAVQKEGTSFGLMNCLLYAGIAAFGLHLFLGTFTPAWDFDVREYHLHGPREWWQAGHISFLAHNVYTSFPFLSEMLSLLAMVVHDDPWSGAISGKVTLGAFSFLSVVATYAIASRCFGHRAGLLAALLLISTPWVTRTSIIAYAESAITFYLIATVMLALRVPEFQHQKKPCGLVAVVGFLAGSAMASKYPGVVSVVIPVGCFLIWHVLKSESSQSTSKKRDVLLTVGIYSIGVSLAVGPWLIRNLSDTGNPIYPLVWSVFGGADWDQSLDEKWKAAHSAPDHNVAMIPIHLKDVALRNDWQNGLLFALAIPAVVMLCKRQAILWLALHASWLLASWWLLTHRIDRFWVPMVPVLSVLAAGVWVANQSKIWRSFLVIVIAVGCVFNYAFCRLDVIGFHVGLSELQAASDRVIRDDLRYLNAALPEGSRVLMVGEAEVFDCRFDTVYNTVFDQSIFQTWTCAADDVLAGTQQSDELPMKPFDEIHARLISEGVTHVYVNWLEILRYRLTYGYTPYVIPDRFRALVDSEVLLRGNATASGNWASLSEQQQNEIRSWKGYDFLMQSNESWGSRVIYRVNPDFER